MPSFWCGLLVQAIGVKSSCAVTRDAGHKVARLLPARIHRQPVIERKMLHESPLQMLAHIRRGHGPDAVVAFRLPEEALGFHVIQDHVPADLVRVPRKFRADLSVDVPRVDKVEVRRLDVRLKNILLAKLEVDSHLYSRLHEVVNGFLTLDVVRDQPAKRGEDEGRCL